MNRVDLVGRLTKDPELRYTDSDLAVCSFTIAVKRQFKNENGEYVADFILCKAFKKRAETIKEYCKKGDLVGVEGRIQTGSYEKDGQTHFTTEIMADNVHFLSTNTNISKEEKNAGNGAQNDSNDGLDDEVFRQFGESIEINDEDIAF